MGFPHFPLLYLANIITLSKVICSCGLFGYWSERFFLARLNVMPKEPVTDIVTKEQTRESCYSIMRTKKCLLPSGETGKCSGKLR